jgi:hypothetical protein
VIRRPATSPPSSPHAIQASAPPAFSIIRVSERPTAIATRSTSRICATLIQGSASGAQFGIETARFGT